MMQRLERGLDHLWLYHLLIMIFCHMQLNIYKDIPTGSDQCCKFLRYFEFQWLQSVPRQYWHVGNLIPRSNNWIEGNLFCFFNERGFLGQVNAIS